MDFNGNLSKDLRELNRLMNRMFGSFDDREGTRALEGPTTRGELASLDWVPAVDVVENNDAYVIKAEIPQVRKEDVKVDIREGVLTVSGTRHQEKEEKGKRFHRVERSYGNFSRSFRLPDNVDETRVSAKFDNGLLVVTLPKSTQPKQDVHDVPVT